MNRPPKPPCEGKTRTTSIDFQIDSYDTLETYSTGELWGLCLDKEESHTMIYLFPVHTNDILRVPYMVKFLPDNCNASAKGGIHLYHKPKSYVRNGKTFAISPPFMCVVELSVDN